VSLRYDEIAEILKIIDGSSCDEVIVEVGDVKLVIRRNGTSGGAPARDVVTPAAKPAVSHAPPPSSPVPRAPPLVHKAPHQIEVTAPMVGTFYRAPSPGAKAFVEIGSSVRKGDPLCLIEVMKLFTTIISEHDGRVAQIGAENGELVEYGRMLFVIEPA
jgi:acetyl-CoA carboxylase biotin carboxyl carrier protein